MNKPTKAELKSTLPQVGELLWIGLRPSSDKPMTEPQTVKVTVKGIVGDRYNGSGNRAVTLIQSEHISTISTLAGSETVKPAQLRRNLLIAGVNLLALEGHQFRIGNEVILEMTDSCRPCHKMEALLGPGGYNAMTGLGGITCKVIQEGEISVGDNLEILN